MDIQNTGVLLEINKDKFKFQILRNENSFLFGKGIFANRDLFEQTLLLFKQDWTKQMSDYYLAVRKNTGEPAKPSNLEEIEEDEASLTILAKGIYVMGRSQIRSMQFSLKKLITIPEYIEINKILLAYEKNLRFKAEPEHGTELGFYLVVGDK